MSENEQMDFGFAPEEKPKAAKAKAAAKDKGITTKKLTLKEEKTEDVKKRVVVRKKATGLVRKNAEHIAEDQINNQAELMASKQRDISISEFFAKNRHLLGFDNASKALLTTIKEAVDNSLDACEEARILPDLEIGIQQRSENRFRVWIQDNGPGIIKAQIPNIFGRLLYGSKFHTLRMARGQQGIGISAAGMYGMLTTGKNVKINSKPGAHSQAHHYELRIDTKLNRPEIIKDEPIEWDIKHGTRVEIELEARYQRGRQSVDEYLAQTAITNPHAQIKYIRPDGEVINYDRSVLEVVHVPEAIKPHPYGVELGVLLKMALDTEAKSASEFLTNEFSRVSPRLSEQILDKAKISARKRPKNISHEDAEALHKAINSTKIMAPRTDCVVPIGEDELLKGLERVVDGDFYTVCTRPPAVYRGNPFQIECALAFGGQGYDATGTAVNNKKDDDEKETMRVLRFANRVPLLYQQAGCAVFKSILGTNWRNYGLSQSRGSLPAGAVTVIVHVASVWVPFTSESKEAIAHYPEIIKEIQLALAECGRRLGTYMRGVKKQKEEGKKQSYIKKYLPAIGEAVRDILELPDDKVELMLEDLKNILEQSRANKL